MAGTSKSGASRKGDDDAKDDKTKKSRDRSKSDPLSSARRTAATVIWVLAVLAALVLAIGALVVALDFNRDNPIVDFVHSTASAIDLGLFKDFEIKDQKNADAMQSARVKSALVNWGIAAVIYLVVGKILDRLIRP